MTRVAVVDDQELTREGLALIINAQPDMEVGWQAGDGTAAVRLAAQDPVDVVLMDIRMPTMDGVRATELLMAQPDAPKVLVLTTFDLDEYVYAALRAGACGFLLKDAPRARLLEAIRLADQDEVVLAPGPTRRLVEQFVSQAPPRPAPAVDSLSPREREVLELVAQGLTNGEIAGRLFLGESTVKTHVARLLAKLGLRDRVQAVVFAYEHGLVRPGR